MPQKDHSSSVLLYAIPPKERITHSGDGPSTSLGAVHSKLRTKERLNKERSLVIALRSSSHLRLPVHNCSFLPDVIDMEDQERQ